MSLEAERFSAANVEPFSFEGERQAIALREASEVVTMKGQDGQRLSGLYLNRDFASNTGIIRLGGMFEDVDSVGLRYTGYQMAAANPENPVLMINVPAHGNSDPLTPAQRKEILGSRHLRLVAASQATAARSRLESADDAVITGQSVGGRLAPDFAVAAAEIGLRPAALMGFGPVGLDARPSLATLGSFFVDGYLAQRRYHQSADDQRLDRGMERFMVALAGRGFRDTHNAVTNDIRIFSKSPSYIGFLLANSPLSDDGGFDAIRRSLDLNPGMPAAFVSGGRDKVTRWPRIEPEVGRLVEEYGGRATWDLWPYDGHSMGISTQQPRFAAGVRSMLESLAE